MMEYSYYIIDPTGNITAIVETPTKRSEQCRIAAFIMELDTRIEQVGFLEQPQSGAAVRLQMMGGEFCGNASICTAALTAQRSGIDDGCIMLEVSGAENPLCIRVQKLAACLYRGTVSMPLPVGMETVKLGKNELPAVHFSGISHLILSDDISADEAEKNIRSWCKALNADALGLMFLSGETLKPYVYVRSTDTAVWESSCASGTTAVAAYLAAKAGKSVSVTLENPGGTLSVKAEYSGDAISSLLLTGSAEIKGKHLICT